MDSQNSQISAPLLECIVRQADRAYGSENRAYSSEICERSFVINIIQYIDIDRNCNVLPIEYDLLIVMFVKAFPSVVWRRR